MAGAHEELPHFTMNHYMVSNTGSDEEGWPWIDVLEDDVCVPPVTSGLIDPTTGIPEVRYYPGKPLPTLLHYCQFFRVGIIGFHKRRLLQDIMGCDFPLLIDTPIDLAKLTYKIRDGEVHTAYYFHYTGIRAHFIYYYFITSLSTCRGWNPGGMLFSYAFSTGPSTQCCCTTSKLCVLQAPTSTQTGP